jgi:hypothetical protein
MLRIRLKDLSSDHHPSKRSDGFKTTEVSYAAPAPSVETVQSVKSLGSDPLIPWNPREPSGSHCDMGVPPVLAQRSRAGRPCQSEWPKKSVSSDFLNAPMSSSAHQEFWGYAFLATSGHRLGSILTTAPFGPKDNVTFEGPLRFIVGPVRGLRSHALRASGGSLRAIRRFPAGS